MNSDFLDRIERLAISAALDPAEWTSVLEEITNQTRSVGSSLLTVAGRGPFVLPTESLGELADAYISDGWYKRDFRYNAVPLLKRQGLFTDQDIFLDCHLPKIPYYAEFLEKFGVGWGLGLRVDTGRDMWCFMLQRGTQTGPYQADEQEAIRPVAEILSRAATLSRQLNYRRLDEGLDITEQLGDAAFYIDRFGRVARMNTRAEAMVTSGRIKLQDSVISFSDAHNEKLLKHIDAAIWPDLRADDEALRPVVIHQHGRRPIIIRAIRIRGDAQPFFAPAYALLVITDLAEQQVVNPQTLIDIFGLTQAEAALSGSLSRTLHLVRAAEALGISHETARTQIKVVFSKLGVSNQLELLRILNDLASFPNENSTRALK